MVEPTVVPRSEHTISRRDIDPDALKVLYRLHEHNYVAYLVGGSVRAQPLPESILEQVPASYRNPGGYWVARAAWMSARAMRSCCAA